MDIRSFPWIFFTKVLAVSHLLLDYETHSFTNTQAVMAIPISVDSVTSIAAQVNELITLLPSGNRKVRKDLLGAARSLYLAVETPMEALLRMEWAEVGSWPSNLLPMSYHPTAVIERSNSNRSRSESL